MEIRCGLHLHYSRGEGAVQAVSLPDLIAARVSSQPPSSLPAGAVGEGDERETAAETLRREEKRMPHAVDDVLVMMETSRRLQ